jgi:TP901 family phage tail tape measure protein
MANAIGFGELFNKGDFDANLSALKAKISEISEAINATATAANTLNTVLGGELKSKINLLATSSTTLDTELKKVRADFEAFKQTVASTKTTVDQYKNANDKLKEKVKEVETESKKLNATQKESGKVAKTASINYGQLSQSLIGVASGAALLYRGITMLRDQISEAVKSSIEFESVMKEVQAISRASASSLTLLTKDAQRLGATTEKTASQVGSAQKELAKLGFTVTEVLASTSSIIDLSTATGEGLAQSATVAAATLRAFGLDAQQMIRVVDVMAGSFVRSGLDLEKFRESMKLVAPIARATNIDIETTTASLSKLADAGLSGSLAGTALRNLFSNMADPTSKLAKRLGFVVENSEDMIKAFKQLRAEGVGLAEAVQMVDVRARPAFFTLLNQVDSVEALTLEYRYLDGEAHDIAETMRDTLKNDIEIASSAFDAMRREMVDGFIPAMREGTQTTTTFIEAIRLFSKGMKDGSAQNETFVGGMFKAVGQIKDAVLYVTMLDHVVNGLNKSWDYFVKSNQEYVEKGKVKETIQDTTTALDSVLDALVKGTEAFDTYTKSNIALKEINEGVSTTIEELMGQYPELVKKVEKYNDGIFKQEEFLKALIIQQQREFKESKASYDSLVLQEKALEELVEKLQETGKSTKQLSDAERLLNVTRELIKKQLPFIIQLENALNDIRNASTEGLEEQYNEQLKLNKILNDYNIELARTAELEAKIAFDRDRSLESLEAYKQAKIRTAQAILQKEIEAIRESEESETLKTARLKIVYEKHKQTRISIEESIVKTLLTLHQEMYAKMVAEDEAYLERFKKHAEDVAKSFEVAIQEIKGINDIMPKQEQAWRNMSSEIEHYNKVREGGLKRFFQLKREESALIQKGKEQNDNLNDADMDRLLQLKDELVEFEKLTRQGIATALRAVSQGVTLLYDNAAVRRENELVAIDRWEQERIRLAGDNAEAITAIEEEAEAKRRKIKIEQAKADKREALFQIAIQTAVNLVRVAWQPWLIAGVALLGAAQAAIVAARPLPEFYKGTENAPEGHAWVGERGRELVKDGKTGKVALTPDKPTIAYLTRGSVVVPHEKTERILASHNPDYNGIVLNKSVEVAQPKQPSIDYDKLIGGFKTAVKDIPLTTTNFDENGVRQFVRKGNARIERLNARYKY